MRVFVTGGTGYFGQRLCRDIIAAGHEVSALARSIGKGAPLEAMGAEIILWINGRGGMIEDSHCLMASKAYGCVVAANITNGKNTGFAGLGCLSNVNGRPEESRLFPRIKEPGDNCVHATINLDKLRWRRKHLRTMHQRRPEMYGLLTQDVKIWQDYPEIPWDYPECEELVNRSQL